MTFQLAKRRRNRLRHQSRSATRECGGAGGFACHRDEENK